MEVQRRQLFTDYVSIIIKQFKRSKQHQNREKGKGITFFVDENLCFFFVFSTKFIFQLFVMLRPISNGRTNKSKEQKTIFFFIRSFSFGKRQTNNVLWIQKSGIIKMFCFFFFSKMSRQKCISSRIVYQMTISLNDSCNVTLEYF